ncbi:MAG TPA: glycosyltransferase [Chitinophagaceae bacterium]|nr:glycosyltransferase [Chitinophagaceae bacterium]
MDLICFCHIRWNFVYQRPQHLMERFAKHNRVFFLEEPVFDQSGKPFMEVNKDGPNLWIITPHLIHGYSLDENVFQQKILLSSFYNEYVIKNYTHWYYTPMALIISNHLQPEMIIYDCMDELSNFNFAPPELKQREKELFRVADLVFTGGHNLYKAKKNAHNNIFPFPSSIDKDHFEKARSIRKEPADQAKISHPIFGFYGVVDERFDIDILREIATRRPQWSFVIIGPVIKIDPATLPQLANIHYLGARNYEVLPYYLSGWDIAMIPFLLNDSTKYISPTKTPEYLAAGVPVISSSIVDVVNPYAINNLIHIADDVEAFINEAEKELAVTDKKSWLARVDFFLKENSWDQTWREMMQHINATLKNKRGSSITTKKEDAYV